MNHVTISHLAKLSAPLLVALTLSGCEVFYSVTRSAPISEWPDEQCVRHAVEQTPGVVGVRGGHRPSEYVNPNAICPSDRFAFSYTFYGAPDSNVLGHVSAWGDCNKPETFSVGRTQINRTLPQEFVDATRPLILRIAQRLERDCGFTGLVASERCTNVVCPPLATEAAEPDSKPLN